MRRVMLYKNFLNILANKYSGTSQNIHKIVCALITRIDTVLTHAFFNSTNDFSCYIFVSFVAKFRQPCLINPSRSLSPEGVFKLTMSG